MGSIQEVSPGALDLQTALQRRNDVRYCKLLYRVLHAHRDKNNSSDVVAVERWNICLYCTLQDTQHLLESLQEGYAALYRCLDTGKRPEVSLLGVTPPPLPFLSGRQDFSFLASV